MNQGQKPGFETVTHPLVIQLRFEFGSLLVIHMYQGPDFYKPDRFYGQPHSQFRTSHPSSIETVDGILPGGQKRDLLENRQLRTKIGGGVFLPPVGSALYEIGLAVKGGLEIETRVIDGIIKSREPVICLVIAVEIYSDPGGQTAGYK